MTMNACQVDGCSKPISDHVHYLCADHTILDLAIEIVQAEPGSTFGKGIGIGGIKKGLD